MTVLSERRTDADTHNSGGPRAPGASRQDFTRAHLAPMLRDTFALYYLRQSLG
jgi:hypothetical protein